MLWKSVLLIRWQPLMQRARAMSLRPDVGGQGKPGDGFGRFLHQPLGVGLDGVDGLFVGEGLVLPDALEEVIPFAPALRLAPVVLIAVVRLFELDGGGEAADDMLGLGPILQGRDEEGISASAFLW
jgi:hypothetical protein